MLSDGSHASGDAELGNAPSSAWARGAYLPRLSAGLCTRFRVLSFEGKSPIFNTKAKYEDASRVYSRGAFSRLCFSVGVWRCLLQDINHENAPLLFLISAAHPYAARR